MPLKENMIDDDVFDHCESLERVDLVGGIHKTIGSLHLESWRDEMRGEIDRINQLLPNTSARRKTEAIRQWIQSASRRIEEYEIQHDNVLKVAMTILTLALWEANLWMALSQTSLSGS